MMIISAFSALFAWAWTYSCHKEILWILWERIPPSVWAEELYFTQRAQRAQRIIKMLLLERDVLRVLCALCVRYITTTRMFCFRTQRAQRSQRFYYITLSLEGSLATRDKSAQRLAKTSNCLLYSFAIPPLRSPVVVKLATSPASAWTAGELKLRVLCALCVSVNLLLP